MRAAVLLAALLAGCAAPVYRDAGGQAAPERVVLECEYDAERAAAAVPNVLDAAYTKARLRAQCLVLRGYRRQ